MTVPCRFDKLIGFSNRVPVFVRLPKGEIWDETLINGAFTKLVRLRLQVSTLKIDSIDSKLHNIRFATR